MALRKKTGYSDKGSSKPQDKRRTQPASEIKTRNKVGEIADVIYGIADSTGYFDPKDVYAQVRETDLTKSVSIILSNLRLLGFGKDDRLRIPVSQDPNVVRKFITLAAKLRKEKTDISFEDAVGLVSPEAPAQNSFPEPKPELAVPQPDIKADRVMSVSPGTGKDYRAVYEESRDKVMKLEGELAGYKEMCVRLMEGLKK